MAFESDPTFGQTAVTLGLATPAQVLEAFKAQRAEGRTRPVSDVLVSLGILTDADVRRISEVMRITGLDVPMPGQAPPIDDEGTGLAGGSSRFRIEPPSDVNLLAALAPARTAAGSEADLLRRGRIEPPSSLDLLQPPGSAGAQRVAPVHAMPVVPTGPRPAELKPAPAPAPAPDPRRAEPAAMDARGRWILAALIVSALALAAWVIWQRVN